MEKNLLNTTDPSKFKLRYLIKEAKFIFDIFRYFILRKSELVKNENISLFGIHGKTENKYSSGQISLKNFPNSVINNENYSNRRKSYIPKIENLSAITNSKKSDMFNNYGLSLKSKISSIKNDKDSYTEEVFINEILNYKNCILENIKQILENGYEKSSKFYPYKKNINIRKLINFCFMVLNYYLNLKNKINDKIKPVLRYDTKIDNFEFIS